MLSQTSLENLNQAFLEGGRLVHLCADENAVHLNAGVLSALSILIPERRTGIELPDLVVHPLARNESINITIQALPLRAPDTFSAATRALVRQALRSKQQWDVFDSLLSVATYPSDIDGYWFGSLLQTIPLAKRDAFWSAYLHTRFEENGIVRRLIDTSGDMDVAPLDAMIAERWALILMWFINAADRRVKDYSTRAVVKLFQAHPSMIWPMINYFLTTDDDELHERVILCAYGALILSPDRDALKTVAEGLLAAYKQTPNDYQNALVRDHIRCLGELAHHFGVLGSNFDPLLPSKRNKSEWPLTLPSDEEVKSWSDDEELRLLARSCLNDDFNHYSIGCLRLWDHAMTKAAGGGSGF